MADVTEINVVTGAQTTRPYTQAELDAIAAYVPLPPPVRVVTARQFKAALAISGLITEAEISSPNLPALAEPAVAAMTQNERIVARSTWANMTTVPEDDPLLEAMRLAAGLTPESKTALFDLAASIP